MSGSNEIQFKDSIDQHIRNVELARAERQRKVENKYSAQTIESGAEKPSAIAYPEKDTEYWLKYWSEKHNKNWYMEWSISIF